MNIIKGHPATRHWCGKDNCSGNVSAKVNPFCGVRGPLQTSDGQLLGCARLAGHDGPHNAYQLSIAVPAEWAAS